MYNYYIVIHVDGKIFRETVEEFPDDYDLNYWESHYSGIYYGYPATVTNVFQILKDKD